jgi:hypothetical protein
MLRNINKPLVCQAGLALELVNTSAYMINKFHE